MKLDATDLRYVSSEEFRVLTSVEMGSKNHEVVPTSLIAQISGLRNGGVNKLIASLAKRNLVSKVQNSRYDGYRLTYGGYDYLAMRALSKRDSMYSVGNQIGVGKESDIYVVADANQNELVLKLHRLGRVSFRAIKEKRDYLGKRKSASWMYMSRLAAQKEWAFMKVLHEHDFPVPRPVDQARHCILMEFIDAYPLRQISDVPNPGRLYSELMDIIVRFAQAGLIHGDFNEFNILIRRETGEPVVIDFPQMISTSHANAEWYFNRDVECIRRFFRRRFRYESSLYPRFTTAASDQTGNPGFKLDVVVAASGFSNKDMNALEEYMKTVDDAEDGSTSPPSSEEESDDGDADSPSDDSESEGPDVAVDTDQRQVASAEPFVEGASTFVTPSTLVPTGSITSVSPDAHEAQVPPESSAPPRDTEEVDGEENRVKDLVSTALSTTRAKQQRKHHSKRSARTAGRQLGSKAKQDKSRLVRANVNDGWD